jgi:ABC-type transporter Mla subunit MlaD
MDQPGTHVLLRGNQPAAADRMRELLARTVQDHVFDQRSNAGALEDIRQRMEGLEWLVKEVREREVAGLTAQLDDLGKRLDESTQKPPQWAESLAEHMELLRSQVAPVAELHSLWADVGTVSENVEVALPQLQSVCDTVGQAVAALQAQDDRLTNLQQSMGRLQQSMESAASRFSRIDKAVAELTQRTGQLDKEISAVKGRAEVSFGALTAKVDQSAEATSRQLTQSLEAMSGTVEGLSGTVEGLSGHMTGISGQVDLIGGQVQAVHGRIEQLDERLADTDDKLGSLDTRLSDHGRGLTSVEGKLGTVAGRLGVVDGKVGTLGGRLDGLDGRLEGVGARIDGFGDTFGARIDGIGDTFGERIDAFGERMDGLGSTVGTRIDGLGSTVSTRIDGLGSTFGDRFGQLDGKLDTATGRFTDVGGQLEKLDRGLAAVGRLVDTTAEQLNSQLEPLADELRSRPGHTDVQEILAKIVDAAQSDVTTQLGSLEETVLTLAEALLRPQGQPGGRPEPRSVPAPRDGAEPLRAEV